MKPKRVQFDFSDKQVRQMEQLQKDAGVRTKKELVDNALTLLAWAIREKRAGRIIASIDEAGRSFEVLLPALENAASGPPTDPAPQQPSLPAIQPAIVR